MKQRERVFRSDSEYIHPGLSFFGVLFCGSHKKQALWCLCGPSWPCWLGQAWMIPTSRGLWRVGEVLLRIFFPDWGEERGPQLTAGGGVPQDSLPTGKSAGSTLWCSTVVGFPLHGARKFPRPISRNLGEVNASTMVTDTHHYTSHQPPT